MKRNRMLGLLFLTAMELHGQTLQLEKQVMVSGGQASGGQFKVSSSVGQIITEKSAGGQFAVQAGFWQVNNDLIFEDEFE